MLLLPLLLLLLLPTLALAQTTRSQPACSHWASPSGGGSACSEAAPCQIATFVGSQSMAQPGAVLCLTNGTYTQNSSMIAIPESWHGTAEKPITIRALEPGKVTIDGGDSLRPVNTNGSYGVIQGINAIRGDNQNVMIRGHHWLVRDLLSWDVGDSGDANIQMSGTDNTVEDCGTWGPARKPIAAGASGGERNTIRRCWARWEANQHPTSNPSNTIEMGYGQNTVTMENTIATWNTGGRVTEPEGLGQLFSTQGSKWLGSIFYLTASDVFPTNALVYGLTDAGSHAQQGDFNPMSNLIFKHVLAYIAPSHPKFGQTRAFYFMEGTDDGAPPGTNNTLSDLTAIAGVNNSFSSSFPTSRVQWGTSVEGAIGAGKSMWVDSHAGPGICKRYVRGQLTTQPLWPWPMNQRIKDGLVQAGYPAVDVTATMEQLFGPIPASCRGGGPPPVVPVPPTNVTATLQGTQVRVTWTDTQTVHTGYAVEHRVGTTPYAPLSDQIPKDARSYTDASPVAGAENCYVVYARGTAGPSGFSEASCVQVGGTPPSPDGGSMTVALTLGLVCTGTYQIGSPVAMHLTCVAPPATR